MKAAGVFASGCAVSCWCWFGQGGGRERGGFPWMRRWVSH